MPFGNTRRGDGNSMGSKYSLKQFDYVIRKCVAVNAVQRIAKAEGIKNLAASIGVNQTTVSRWINMPVIENGEYPEGKESYAGNRLEPSLEQLLNIASQKEISLTSMIVDSIEADERKRFALTDSSGNFDVNNADRDVLPLLYGTVRDEALKLKDNLDIKAEKKIPIQVSIRASMIQQLRYVGFFISASGDLDHFILETSEAIKEDVVPAIMWIADKEKYPYRCNMVIPMSRDYMFVYMRQDDSNMDRGMMIFPFDEDITGEHYLCGAGILMSLNRKDYDPVMQWVVMLKIGENDDEITQKLSGSNIDRTINKVRKQFRKYDVIDKAFFNNSAMKEADVLIEPVLSDKFPRAKNHRLDFRSLKKAQEKLFKMLYGEELDQANPNKPSLDEAWNDAAKSIK